METPKSWGWDRPGFFLGGSCYTLTGGHSFLEVAMRSACALLLVLLVASSLGLADAGKKGKKSPKASEDAGALPATPCDVPPHDIAM